MLTVFLLVGYIFANAGGLLNQAVLVIYRSILPADGAQFAMVTHYLVNIISRDFIVLVPARKYRFNIIRDKTLIPV